MTQFVSASYPDEDRAHTAVEALAEAHFAHADIRVIKLDGERSEEVPIAHRTWVPQCIALFGSLGALLGGLGASLVATGEIAGPTVLIASGPVAAGLQGAMAGAIAGAFFGAFGGIGWWKDEPDFEATEIKRGAVVVGVTAPEGRVGEAISVLAGAGGVGVHV